MSDKARKPEDRSNVHKGNRGSPVSNLAPPQLAAAAAAAMMPHGSYEITSSHHMHPHHPLQYSAIIRPPPTIHHMSPHLGRVTNDLGPPIFMPSLNLGVPKLQQQSSPSTSQSNNSGGLPGNSGGSSAASSTTSGSSKTSKSSQPSMNTPTAAFMAPTDLIQFPASAFHSPHGHAMRPPSGGQGAYISASAPPPPSHPSSMNMKFSAPQSLSSSTIAKPTPIPASATSSGIVRPTPKSVTNSQGAGAGVKREQQPTSASSKGVMSSSATKGEPPSTSVNLMYGFAPHPMMSYGILNAAAAAAVTATPPSHGQLSKMLLGGSQHPSSHPPPPPSSASRSSKSDGSNGSSKAAASQVASSAAAGASHKSGSYIVDGYTNRSSMGLSTSAQPTSTAATYMDTKMEHPPQPSAVPILPQHGISSLPLPHPPSSSSSSPSTAYTLPSPPSPSSSATASGSGGGGKDRPTTAEAAASNLIISKQALTGKQIASITGNSCSSGGGGTTTTTLGQSSSTTAAETSSSCSSYATSPVSNSNLIVMATVASSLGAGGGGGGTASGGNRSNSSADFVMLSQSQGQEGSVMEWSSSSQQQQQQQGRSTSSVSSSMSSATGSGGSVVVAPSSSSSMAEQQQQQGGGGSSVHSSHHNHHHHTSSNGGASRDAATSSISATTAASSSFSGHLSAGGGGGVMGSPSKSLTASPGGGTTSSPRPHILRGVKRPHESSWKENSHHNPGSSTFLNKLSNTNSCAKQKVSRQDYGAPISPGSHEMGGGLSNHLSSKSEPPDMTASPRKKPRKQNVVANDDQYASNVPDSLVSMGTSEAQLYHEGGRTQGEELGSKSQPLFYNSISSRNARVKTESRDAGVGKEVEMRYLSQLKKCPYPINGVYKVHHRAARNHFRRHADIKHREDHRPSVCEIADDKTSLQRASGWKIIHFSSQLQEMSEVEEDILKTMQRLQDSVNNLDQTGTCQVDPECTGSFKELVQGNLDRSNRVLSHISDTKLEIEKVLEHKLQVSELLKKFSTQKPSAQSIRNSSSNHQHKNCS